MRAEAEAAPVPAGDEQKKLRDQLIALVPTEAVALYVAAIGAAAEADEWVRWVCFGLVLVGTPVWITVNYWETRGSRGAIPWFEVVVGTIAFLAWTTTVPRGTLDELGGSTWVGTLIVVIVSAVLALATRMRAIWAKEPAPAPVPPAPVPAV
jgi:hypothetical protein